MSELPVILIVDDEISNIEIISATLEEDYEICFALSGEQALEVAHAARPDLIILDIVMPGMDGYELCRLIKLDPVLADVPVIFATALGAADAEVRGLSLGAIDYVTKPFQPVALRRRVANHIDMKRMRDQLSDLAMTDALTGLGNRRLLEQQLQGELRRLGRDGGFLSVILMDIDFFKRFNDSYGHLAGDKCLRIVGEALGATARRGGDITARYGGEEFACILPDTGHADAMQIAETMRARIEALGIPNTGSSVSSVVTVSIGVATGQCTQGMEMEFWISNADRMLYHSKSLGRNRVSGQVLTSQAEIWIDHATPSSPDHTGATPPARTRIDLPKAG